MPEGGIPLLYDSPHSGRLYPDDFNHACDLAALHLVEDRDVDALFAGVTATGASFLKALFPRTYIDVNRDVTDIDPQFIDADEYAAARPTERAKLGIGLLHTRIKDTRIYDRALTASEVEHRIQAYYTPYHTALKTALDQLYHTHGHVYHINCHSMPSTIAMAHGRPVDIVLSDDNRTCAYAFRHAAQDFFLSKGLRVSINSPFKGAALIKNYADPAEARHSLQIEINRALYMHEDTLKRSRNFKEFQDIIKEFTVCMAAYVR